MKTIIHFLFLLSLTIVLPAEFYGQTTPRDTFFLLKKKGLLKKLGKSIYRENIPTDPVKTVNLFLQFKGKIIRSIFIAPTGFNKISDSGGAKKKLASRIGDYLHRNTRNDVVRKNLFFKEGDRVLPFLIADNERFLRDLSFIRDAQIIVEGDSLSPDVVDVIIITKDVFSIGGSLKFNNTKRMQANLRDENLLGTGHRLEISSIADKERRPYYGSGAVFTMRNAFHSFFNLTAGYKTFNPAFNSGRAEESNLFFYADKPLISRYSPWTGSAAFSYTVNENAYLADSLFHSEFKYRSLLTDVWGGYNLGYRNRRDEDSDKRLRHFLGIRSFYKVFYSVPDRFKSVYNYSYANINGLLMSYSLYKQNFYRTNFIYGFGRNEDVPQGLNGTVIAGYTNKQGVKRAYYGLEFDGTKLSSKGNFTGYTLRTGSFINGRGFQDAEVLAGINGFSKLFKLNQNWRLRYFFSGNFTKQFNTHLNSPLILQSGYGLPYFRNSTDAADTRSTVKFESVFFNLQQVLGFRFAPFVFTDVSFLRPQFQPGHQTKGYTAIGGGFRTRNENLTFGTVEVKGYHFPKVYPGMPSWRIEFGTNIRFKYNSSFIRRPDFISAN